MSKKILVVACLVMMTTVFTGCDLLGGDKNKEVTKEGTNNIEQNQESNKESDKNGSGDGNYYETITDLMARGKTMKCTFTQDIESGETATGVIYMADKKARTEITVKNTDGSSGKMFAIVDQEWTHNWIEGASEGIKMKLEASELSEENEETVSDMTDEVEFECKLWKKDNSKFKVPTNIEFQDMSEMMEGFEDVDLEKEIKDAEAMANEFLCNHCKNAPDPVECLDGVVCDWSK